MQQVHQRIADQAPARGRAPGIREFDLAHAREYAEQHAAPLCSSFIARIAAIAAATRAAPPSDRVLDEHILSDSAPRALQLIAGADPRAVAIVARRWPSAPAPAPIACALGLLLGAWLGVSRFAGRGACSPSSTRSLALPSVVVGLVVYLLLSRSGPAGLPGLAVLLPGDGAGAGDAGAAGRHRADAPGGRGCRRSHGEQLRSLGAGAAAAQPAAGLGRALCAADGADRLLRPRDLRSRAR